MKSCSQNPLVSSVGSSPKNILQSKRSSATQSAQLTDDLMDAQMTNILVMDLFNNRIFAVCQGTTTPLTTNRHVHNILISEQDDEFLSDNNI